MKDTITKHGNSTIQHGPYNDRTYLMKLDPNDTAEIIPFIDKLCNKENYGKSFAVISQEVLPEFLRNGYKIEACVPDFYSTDNAGYFLGKYYNSSREKINNSKLKPLEAMYPRETKKAAPAITPGLPAGYTIKQVPPEGCSEMAILYSKVFADYPFPITDPDYLKEIYGSLTDFIGIYHGSTLVAVGSGEKDTEYKKAEVTDIAVDPEYRGKKLSYLLIDAVEQNMKHNNYRICYTIARLPSIGMNRAFLAGGYLFGGTLFNNTRIGTGIESMNVWYKHIR